MSDLEVNLNKQNILNLLLRIDAKLDKLLKPKMKKMWKRTKEGMSIVEVPEGEPNE